VLINKQSEQNSLKLSLNISVEQRHFTQVLRASLYM